MAEPFNDGQNIAGAIKLAADMGAAQGEQRQAGNVPYVVIPTDHKVVTLGNEVFGDFRDFPHRKKAHVVVKDAASFIGYWEQFHDESLVFADDVTAKIQAIFDYHYPSPERSARWRQHRCTLQMTHSDEWTRWTGSNAKQMDQATFAEFLEDNAPDVVKPDAAAMMEIARDFRAKNEVTFNRSERLSSGQVRINYQENLSAKMGAGEVDVPESFVIRIPVYLSEDKIDITARLRFRINSGKLSLWYDLLRYKEAQRKAFDAALGAVSEAIGQPILLGDPGAL